MRKGERKKWKRNQNKVHEKWKRYSKSEREMRVPLTKTRGAKRKNWKRHKKERNGKKIIKQASKF